MSVAKLVTKRSTGWLWLWSEARKLPVHKVEPDSTYGLVLQLVRLGHHISTIFCTLCPGIALDYLEVRAGGLHWHHFTATCNSDGSRWRPRPSDGTTASQEAAGGESVSY